jgi:hypothetical protein
MTSSARRGDVATQSRDIVAQKRPFCATRQFVAKYDASPCWIEVCNDFGSIFPAHGCWLKAVGLGDASVGAAGRSGERGKFRRVRAILKKLRIGAMREL